MKETEIEDLLNELFPSRDLEFQVAFQEPYLQVVVNYNPTLSFDRLKILNTIQGTIATLDLSEIEFLALYTREMGSQESDWTICVDVSVADATLEEESEETQLDAVSTAFGEIDPELVSSDSKDQFRDNVSPEFAEQMTIIQQRRESRPHSSGDILSNSIASSPGRSQRKSIVVGLLITVSIALVCGLISSNIVNQAQTSESVLTNIPVGWYALPGMLFGLFIGLLIAMNTGTRPFFSFIMSVATVIAFVSISGWLIFTPEVTLEAIFSLDLLVFLGILVGFSGAYLVKHGSGRILNPGLGGLIQGVLSFETLVTTIAVILAFSSGWQLGNGPPPEEWFIQEEEPLSAVYLFMAFLNQK